MINKARWDDRAVAHAGSEYYGFDRFIDDPEYLSGVVRFDRPRFGDVAGLRGVHLQCHIGTDTVSLARLGARMSGLDFSSAALTQARRLAASTDMDLAYRAVHRLLPTPSIQPAAELYAARSRCGVCADLACHQSVVAVREPGLMSARAIIGQSPRGTCAVGFAVP